MSHDYAASGNPPPAIPPQERDPRPTGEVVKSLTANAQELLRKEIELAKLEISEILVARVTAVAMFAGAGVVGLFILGFVGVTGAKALDLVLPEWAAWLIVTAVYILIAAILAMIGKRKLTKPSSSPDRTKASVEETVAWAKKRVQP
ncbi:phage holin family protein [Egicoccus sp. AB-alg6-2]|uniref:phage holin family protein n=1 Tax=Egicoccus sp. AB-alg6-2 TaxID=3242692 RepID=UPI00359EF3E4